VAIVALLTGVAGFILSYAQYRETKAHVRLSLHPTSGFGECSRITLAVSNQSSNAISLARPFWQLEGRRASAFGTMKARGTKNTEGPIFVPSQGVWEFDLVLRQFLRKHLREYPRATRMKISVNDYNGHTWKLEPGPTVELLREVATPC
jgi:hypothetical protein